MSKGVKTLQNVNVLEQREFDMLVMIEAKLKRKWGFKFEMLKRSIYDVKVARIKKGKVILIRKSKGEVWKGGLI